MAACGGAKAARPDPAAAPGPSPSDGQALCSPPDSSPGTPHLSPRPSGTGSWTPCLPTPAPQVLQEKGFTSKTWFVFRLRARVSSRSPAPATSPPWAYCLLPPSDSGPGVRASPRGVVPSKRWEAMAAWWDMLFRTMSPFRHSTTSCRVAGTACETGLGSLGAGGNGGQQVRGAWGVLWGGACEGRPGEGPRDSRQRPSWSPTKSSCPSLGASGLLLTMGPGGRSSHGGWAQGDRLWCQLGPSSGHRAQTPSRLVGLNQAAQTPTSSPSPSPWPHPHLLLEVAALLVVDEHQVEVVAHGELLVDVPHGGCELVARQEEADGDGLSCRARRGQGGAGQAPCPLPTGGPGPLVSSWLRPAGTGVAEHQAQDTR